MVRIRLSRIGAKNKPCYRVVVTDSRSARDGRFIEQIGFFNSVHKESKEVFVDVNRVNYWMKQGAVLSSRVVSLIKTYKKQRIIKNKNE